MRSLERIEEKSEELVVGIAGRASLWVRGEAVGTATSPTHY